MNIIIISRQSTVKFDSLCSGPWSGTRLNQKKNIDILVIFYKHFHTYNLCQVIISCWWHLVQASMHYERNYTSYFCIYHILSSIVCTFYIENDAEIFPAHYTWEVAEKGFKMALWWINLQWLILLKLFLKKNCQKIIVKFRCTLYSYAHYTR
jgi:hypothetical protein